MMRKTVVGVLAFRSAASASATRFCMGINPAISCRNAHTVMWQRAHRQTRALSGLVGGQAGGSGSSEKKLVLDPEKLADGRKEALAEAMAEYGQEMASHLIGQIERGQNLMQLAAQNARKLAANRLPPMEAVAYERHMLLLTALCFQAYPQLLPGVFGVDRLSTVEAINEVRVSRLRCLSYAVLDDAAKWGNVFCHALTRAGYDCNDHTACGRALGESAVLALEAAEKVQRKAGAK